jgi:hypothetical protein
MTCALTTSRAADNPHAGHSCQRSAGVLGRPFRLPRFGWFRAESTLTSTRPALSALYQTLVHWFNQDGTAILPTPHPMIFEAEYGNLH